MNVMTDFSKPAVIDRVWFRARYGQNFPDLLDEEKNGFLDSCIEDVYTLFYGVSDLWRHLERTVYVSKTQMCYGLLTAWYIADLFPDVTIGVLGTGSGLPVRSKKIGNTTIQFGSVASSSGAVNNADLLQALKSNAFGVKAYMMIKTSSLLNLFLKSR